MIRALERAFPYLLCIPAVAALIYVDGLLYPYLTPKTLIVRGAFVLLAAAFAALALSGRKFYFERLRDYWTWIPGILLMWAYLCSLFGIDLYHSFWSIFDRGDGLLTFTAVVGFFYLTLLYADEPRRGGTEVSRSERADDAFIKKLFSIIAWTASLAALFGIVQWLQWATGLDIPFVPGEADRVSSTFGNPTFFSSYVALALFVTLAHAEDIRGNWRRWAYVGAALQALGILAGATRGSLVAFIVAGIVALLYCAWRGSERYRSYARYGLAGLVIVSALFITFRAQLVSVPFAPVARLAAISLSDPTVESRLFIWRNVVPEAFKSPIVGVGSEHIQVLFNRFYDPTKIVEEWFDRTHNAFLDYLAQYGILGFLLYLALIGALLREALLLLRSTGATAQYRGFLFLLAAVVYAVQNFFVFDTALTLWLFLMLFAAMLVWKGESTPRSLPLRPMPQWLPLGAAALIALLVIPVSFMPLRANLLLAEGYLYQLYDVRRSVDAVEKGWKLGTYADIEYGYQLYEWYTERQMTQLEGEARIVAYRAARNVLEANYEKYPYDARTVVYYAHVLDVAPKGEEADESRVREVLARAIELSPKRIQPRYLLANIAIRKGDALPPGSAAKREQYEEAIQELRSYSELVPDFAEPYYIIATLYQTLKDNAAAKEWADKGLAVYKPDLNTARRASRYYVTNEDWENAKLFLQDIMASEPQNYPVLYDLAKAEFLAGNPDRAREIVTELREKAPGLVETDPAFLSALGE